MNALLFAVPIWTAVGLALGIVYFAALHWNVRWFVSGRSLAAAVTLQVARLVAMAVGLSVIAVHWGAVPLLASAGGILVARAVSLRWVRRG